MTAFRRLLVSCALGILFVLPGCPAADGCETSADCPAEQLCVDSVCEPRGDGGALCVATECDDGNPCNGRETCGPTGACVPGTALAAGGECDADGSPTTRELCVAGACSATRCGDGVVDASNGEVCDDGNAIDGDGCDACRWSCTEASDCDDGDTCNGAETCDVSTHRCGAGTALDDDSDCDGTLGRCSAGECLPRACGTAADCDDGNPCNGVEACTALGCARGPALSCDDHNACTEDRCDPASRGTPCVHRLIDADGDGHPPSSLGECGDDCDDSQPLVYGGAADLCDGVDNDCDGATDEGTIGMWYPDCDGDGYAAAGASGIESCAPPAPGLALCTTGGGWTTRSPTSGADCNDANAAVSPGQTTPQSTPIPGADPSRDFDYDCDGLERATFPNVGRCISAGLSCTATPGFTGMVAACGATASYLSACTGFGTACNGRLALRTQTCR